MAGLYIPGVTEAVDFAGGFVRGMDPTRRGGSWARPGDAFMQGFPTAPDILDQEVILAQLNKKRRLAALRGRAATFLTGPRGVGEGLPTGEIAQAFLRAAVEGQVYNPTLGPGQQLPAPRLPRPSRPPTPDQPSQPDLGNLAT